MIRMHFSQTQLYKDCWFILVLLFIIVASLAYLRSYQERTYQVNFCCEILVHVFFKTYIRLCSLIFGRSTHDPSCFGSSEAVSEAEAWKKQVGKQPGHAELMGSRFQEPVRKRRSWKTHGFENASFDILQRYPHTPYNLRVEFPHFFSRECVEACRPCPRTARERKHCRKKCSCRQPPADSVQKVGVHHQFMTFFVRQHWGFPEFHGKENPEPGNIPPPNNKA